VINLCLERKALFTITADQDRGTRDSIKEIKEWRAYQGDKEIGKTIHTMNNTKEAFRLIVLGWPKLKAELFDSSPYFYHAIATNRKEEAGEVIKLHNQRGEVENYIREIKSGFGMDWMSCAEAYANAVFFKIGLLFVTFSWR
jgi:hypothetical protein